jgi:ribosomal protein S7
MKQNMTASVATMNIKKAAIWRIIPVPLVKTRRVNISMDIFVSETASANKHSMATAGSQIDVNSP